MPKYLNSGGNLIFDTAIYVPAMTYPTIAASGPITTTSITVPGVQPYDIISWSLLSPPAHLALANITVSALNTLTITWSSDNVGITGGTTPALLEVTRIDGINIGLSIVPQAIV